MNHRCLAPDELEAVRALPAGDPRRDEAEACPRCRALLESYTEFLEDRSVPAAADPARAQQRLRDAFERALAEDAAGGAASSPGAGPQRGPVPLKLVPPRKRSAWPALTGPRLAWASAAALLVVAGLYAVPRLPGLRPGGEVLRSEAGPDSAAASGRPALHGARAVAAGLELRWTPAAGADGYRVVFLDESFARVAVMGPIADTVMVLEPGRLPQGLAPRSTVAWQVEALQGGFVIGTSGTAVIEVP